ncbi:LamG-like jellyroll fold domain-containing protein [Chitinophaga rhizophila]|uniref:T9SS type A sorting domain-containing protein n=1 Tax=Chitinophaga rhizophila TaxID=2866212 RepID=A0ABS7G639_9BACT|nr:LamG-like jellyroll fold domain-containing protein [Chitinophaga rhizophila]MBW8683126.1 T9SS type A sorting domain-containing protein [Chitinophaga rhizophila]
MKRTLKLIGLYLLLLTFINEETNAQMVMSRQAKTLTTSNGENFYAYEYRPQGYNPTGNIMHPLIIFLHGIGERSDNINDLPKLENLGLPLVIKDGSTMAFNWNGNTESFVVMAPMSRASSSINNLSRWNTEYIQATIDYAINNLKVDTNRIYLTGLSYGGGGTLNYISVNTSFIRRIAAAAPVSSPAHFNSNGPTYVKNANLPLWAFVGALDDLTPPIHSENVVNGINSLNPAVRARLSIIANGAHDWKTYNAVYYHLNQPNGVYENPISLYEWFLGQNKSLPANILPVANAGPTQNISTIPGNATLDGSGSSDADGIVRYLWRQISGPKTITISNTYTSSTTAAAAHKTKNISGLTIAGTYQFELTVVDARAGISKSVVSINVTTPTNGKAVTFNAIGGRIIAGNVAQFKNATAFTVEAYFKYDGTATDWTNAEAGIFRNYVSNTDRIRLYVQKATNSIHFTLANGTDVKGYTAANAVSPDTWYHVAAVFDGTQTGNADRMKIYINGVQQTLSFTGTIPAITSGSTPVCHFGGDPSASLLLAIDEVRVWSTALTSSTINSWKNKLLGNCHPNANSLFLYWPLDDDTNPSYAAAGLGTSYPSPIFYNSYIQSPLGLDPIPCPVDLGKAVTFNAIGGRIIAGNVAQFKNATAFTVEAYFKYDGTATDWTNAEAGIFRNYVSNTDRIRLYVQKATNSVHFTLANGTDVKGYTAANVVSPDTWYHVAAVFDGTQTGNTDRMKIYINGVQQTLSFTGAIPAITSGSTPVCHFGGDPSASLLLAIDEVRVWGTALTSSTINSWKNKLLGNCHPNANSLFLYWPLDDDTNPSYAAAALGTSYPSPIFYHNYIQSSLATAASGCNQASLALAEYPGKITNNKFFISKIYPNPTEGFLSLDINTSIPAVTTVTVTDMSGRRVYQKTTQLNQGSTREALNLTALPAGTYILDIINNKGLRTTHKILKR